MVHSVQRADPGLKCWSALSKPNGHTGGERGVLAANWPGANSKGHQAAAGWRREVVVHGERGQTRRSGRCSGRENKFTVCDAVVRAWSRGCEGSTNLGSYPYRVQTLRTTEGRRDSSRFQEGRRDRLNDCSCALHGRTRTIPRAWREYNSAWGNTRKRSGQPRVWTTCTTLGDSRWRGRWMQRLQPMIREHGEQPIIACMLAKGTAGQHVERRYTRHLLDSRRS